MDTHGCVFFDTETKYSPDEVGGWDDPAKMVFAHGCAHLAFTRDYRTYLSGDPDRQDMHDDTERMFDDLCSADLIIGFNIIQFDYKLLQPLASRYDVQLNDLPTFDILREIGELMGKPFPVSLRSLASYNLGPYGKKTEDPARIPKMYRDGYIEEVTNYCRHDVWMTRMLFMIGYYEKKLFVRGRRNKTIELNTSSWQKIVKSRYKGERIII